MSTLDDRNMPVDPFGIKRRLNDATPEEWDSAVKRYQYPEIGSEDYFQGSIFDKADDLLKEWNEPVQQDEVNEP